MRSFDEKKVKKKLEKIDTKNQSIKARFWIKNDGAITLKM